MSSVLQVGEKGVYLQCFCQLPVYTLFNVVSFGTCVRSPQLNKKANILQRLMF